MVRSIPSPSVEVRRKATWQRLNVGFSVCRRDDGGFAETAVSRRKQGSSTLCFLGRQALQALLIKSQVRRRKSDPLPAKIDRREISSCPALGGEFVSFFQLRSSRINKNSLKQVHLVLRNDLPNSSSANPRTSSAAELDYLALTKKQKPDLVLDPFLST